jgi:hypothetical protein
VNQFVARAAYHSALLLRTFRPENMARFEVKKTFVEIEKRYLCAEVDAGFTLQNTMDDDWI